MGSPLMRNSQPFAGLSRQRQRDAFIRVRNRIRQAAPILGGSFFTRDYLHGENGWADIWFLGRKAPIFYSATLETTRHACKERVLAAAWERSYELVPEPEACSADSAVRDARTGHDVLSAREPVRYAELEGKTRLDWVYAQSAAIAGSDGFEVFEHWTLHHDCRHGIGLHATLDVPFLAIEAINAFVARFLTSGAAYRDPQPRSFGREEIVRWGLEANAVADPWDWPDPRSAPMNQELDSGIPVSSSPAPPGDQRPRS